MPCQPAGHRALESSMKMSTSNPRSSNTNHLEICCQSSCVFEFWQKHWGKGRISNMLAEIKRWHDPSILRSNESYQVRATYLQIVPCLTLNPVLHQLQTSIFQLSSPASAKTMARFTCPGICHLLIPGIVKLSSTLWS